jgi:NADPH:quinone reductase-like Zn-dependent oxidoreductase
MRGEHSECTSFGVMGMTQQGTFAERVAVPVENVFPKPAHLNFTQAAALPLSHLTAWRMLLTRAEVQAGESVLIHGIGGGVALAGLQIAKMIGTETVVTSSSDAKLDRARELGADHLLNYKEVDDLADHVVEAVGGRGVDVAFDAVGAETWPVDFAAVRKGGRIVLCGITTGPIARTNLQQLYWRQLTVMGSTLGSHEEMRSLLRAVDVERLEPVVDSTQPLSEAQDAMRRMQEGRQFGKIVLEMPG